jgi:phosphate starvation-inducible PhoH-like protein
MPAPVECRPKNPIKFKLQLNEEQKRAKAIILENSITLLKGKWGSGKTLLATQCALDGLYRKEYDRIIISRPTVSDEEIGFLKGDMEDKMSPWMRPIYDNMYQLYDRAKIDKDKADGKIEIIPFSFMRGVTFVNSFVIIDEVQNVTKKQLGMVLSRLGKGSKMVLSGDSSQTDLRSGSCFSVLEKISNEVEGVSFVELKSNHRNPIAELILPYFE